MNDLISRQAAIESIRECAEAAHDNREWDMEQGYLNAIECLEEEPIAEPERKKGKWVIEEKGMRVTIYKCSECGRTVLDATRDDVSADYPFCHCGARMEEEIK